MRPEEELPRFYRWLFTWFSSPDLNEELEGDLLEWFEEDKALYGLREARKKYKKEVLKMIRPSVMRHFRIFQGINTFDMFKNYLKLSFRNLWRDKEHSLVSILGLAAGIVASVLIFQYTNFELSYDSMHEEQDGKIYRLSRRTTVIETGEMTSQSADNFHAMQEAVVEEVPEVMYSTKLFQANGVFTLGDVGHTETNVFYNTGSFFDVFSFPLLEGDASDLDKPGTVFISQNLAKRIFGEGDPMGQLLRYNDNFSNVVLELQVKGIFADIPDNSHFKANAFLTYPDLHTFSDNGWFGSLRMQDVTWRWISFHTYVKVVPGTDESLLSDKLNTFIRKYRDPYDESQGRQQNIILHHLSDLHFIKDFNAQIEPSGDLKTVNMFRFIGILIVLIAWINFVNMSSARAVRRAREVGVRKALGAFKNQLMQQFLLETVITNLLALFLSVGILILIIPAFHGFIGTAVFDYFSQFWLFWAIYLSAFLLGALFSGLYPALVLTRFEPIKVLRGNFSHSAQGIWLRRTLMFFQFGLVLVMLSGILAIRSQIQFMMGQDIGLNIEQTLVLDAPPPFLRDSTYSQRIEAYRNDIEQIAAVTNTSLSSFVPGLRNNFGQTIYRADRPSTESIFLYRTSVDAGFTDFYDIQLVEGRPFDESLKGDGNVILLNEQAVREFGFESPQDAIGKQIVYPTGEQPRIVGVVKDFNQMGIKFPVDPQVMNLDTARLSTYINVKLGTEGIGQTISTLEETYRSFFPGAPFNSFFLDQTFNELYEADKKFSEVLKFFALVAIFISCLGIFGLSSFLINQKLKEVSIRKVLGAGTQEITRVLTKEYLWLITCATLAAVPVAYWLIQRWLDTFLTRTKVDLFMFVLPVLGLIMVLVLTIGNKTWKAVRTNPARTLKNE